VIPVGLLASVIGQLISTQAASPSSRYIKILMLFDLQYLIISLRTFEKIKPAVAKPKHKTLNT
jgi:hypothetical protein